MDRIQAMQVFSRVVETNSFVRAAETLALPPSSVTSIIKNLEKFLEVRLLHRTTRSLSLTEDGQRYYARCREILDLVEDTEASMRGPGQQAQGRLRVDMSGSIARAMLLPHLHDFRARYPDIHLVIGVEDRQLDLIQEGIDCVIRTGELRDSSLVARRIGTFDWITCAAPAYLRRFGTPHTLEDLGRHRCIQYFSAGTGRGADLSFRRAGETVVVSMQGDVSINDTELYIRLCMDGHGLIQLARVLVAEHLDTGRLVEVLPANAPPPAPVSLVYPHRRFLRPAVRAFTEWAQTLFDRTDAAAAG